MVTLLLYVVAVLGVTVEQTELLWTKPAGEKAYISCKVTDLTTTYIHWYQQKDGEPLKRILYVRQDGSGLTHDSNSKDSNDFTISSLMLVTVAVLGVTVEQTNLLWTKPAGKKVYISCKVTDLTTTYIHWYQQKDGEALKRILYIRQDGSGLTHDPNHKEANDFTVKVNQRSSSYDLRVDTLKTSHSAVYYCACWESGTVTCIIHILYKNSHSIKHLAEIRGGRITQISKVAVLGLTVEQTDLLWTKPAGKSVYIKCKVTDLSTTYVHWYQQKDGEALKRILYASGTEVSAVELSQKFLMTKAATKTAIIECTFPSDCYYYIHWYQKKEKETLRRVQYVDISDGDTQNEPGFEFLKSEKKAGNQFVLKIPNLKKEHSATYYCACWDWSGTVREQGHEVRRVLRAVNARKAAGPDSVTGKRLKVRADQLSAVLTKIFNLSLSKSIIPPCLKSATIIPLPKKNTTSNLSDYRPVALTLVIMKCFERLVLHHIKAILPLTFDPHQFAYKANRTEKSLDTSSGMVVRDELYLKHEGLEVQLDSSPLP
ncbi:hypothetical protein NFI96_017480 [Prochilodus magdalenae]|nr:hypothetical protein NFI96_017480 [Prochilodus magdalenae]